MFCGKLKGKCVNINHAKFGELNAFFNDRAFIAFICNVQGISANEKEDKIFSDHFFVGKLIEFILVKTTERESLRNIKLY